MPTFIKIAIRNIIRNTRRSLITLSAVGFGLGALIFIWSFVEGAHKQMIENYTSMVTSHIQIHQKGFQENQKLEIAIPDPAPLIDTIKQFPQVEAYSTRVKAVGLISSAESSAGVQIFGVDPSNEKKITRFPNRIKEGAFLKDTDREGIVIGSALARNLNIGLDGKIVIMSQALDGSVAAGAFYVRGLFDTGTEEVDKGLVLITQQAAQELFVMGDAVSEIAVQLKRVEDSISVANKLKQALNKGPYEVLSWEEISLSFRQWIEFDNGFIWMIVLIVMIIVAIGILNTVLMGVMERTREFGILLAIGTRSNQIIQMVCWESVMLGLLGSLFGALVGIGLTFAFGHTGIDLTVFTKALNSFYIDSVIYPQLNILNILISLVLVFVTSVVVSLYPAWHAARLKPIEAIRSI